MRGPERERDVEGSGAAGKSFPRSAKPAQLPLVARSSLHNFLGNQQIQTLFDAGEIQAKLRMSQPGDADEMEADRVADQIAAGHSPESFSAGPASGIGPSARAIHRKCACHGGAKCPECETEEVEGAKGIHRKASAGPAHSHSSSAMKNIVRGLGGGRSLDSPVRSSMESRFGQDFSAVRIHDDPSAADSANAINARAFTFGSDIAFARGEYAPNTPSGLRLLVHELVHVIQQRGGKDRVSRAPAEQYRTKGIELKAAEMTTEADKSFWSKRLGRLFQVFLDSRILGNANPEERDAVLSAIWRIKPAEGFKNTVSELITIPSRKQAAGSKTVLYKITFAPISKQLPKVEATFVGEGAAAEIKSTGSAPKDFVPQRPSWRHSGFPDNKPDKYWKGQPEEEKQLFAFITNSAPQTFDQTVSTKVVSKVKKKTAEREAFYKIKGAKDATGKITDLTIIFLGTPQRSEQVPDADYHSKDGVDEEIDHIKTALDPKERDKLGQINGATGLPPDEQTPLKYAIWQYFVAGTRNSEVDAIIPIPKTSKRIFYTLRFHAKAKDNTVDVDVKRIGEEGKEVKFDVTRLSLYRIANFSVLSKDIPKLKAWIQSRYPAVTVTGDTAKEICANVDAQIRAGASKKDWFLKNYGINILDKTEGTKRLSGTHKKTFHEAFQVRGVKEFSAEELITLESVLETMSDGIVAGFKGLQMIRQDREIEAISAHKKWVEKKHKKDDPVTGGQSVGESPDDSGAFKDRTVIIYDGAHLSDASLFMGGRQGKDPARVETSAGGTFAHELGHVVSWGPGVKDAFDNLVKKKKIETFTWYAASQPDKDFFAESFMLYQLDPEWLQAHSSEIFDFFDVLTKTGSPPKQ